MFERCSRARWNTNRLIYAAVLLFVVSASVPACAGSILNLPILSGGFIQYQRCARNPVLWGRGLRVGELLYGNNVLPMLPGRLVFASGNFVGSSSAGWFWGAGGSLSVKGCADLNHDGRCGSGDFKGTLMTGSFLDAKLVDLNGKEVLEAQVVDQINPQLAALLHLAAGTHTQELDLTLTSIGSRRVRYAVDGGSLKDCRTVPESSSLLLVAASLLGLGVIGFSPSAASKLKGPSTQD